MSSVLSLLRVSICLSLLKFLKASSEISPENVTIFPHPFFIDPRDSSVMEGEGSVCYMPQTSFLERLSNPANIEKFDKIIRCPTAPLFLSHHLQENGLKIVSMEQNPLSKAVQALEFYANPETGAQASQSRFIRCFDNLKLEAEKWTSTPSKEQIAAIGACPDEVKQKVFEVINERGYSPEALKNWIALSAEKSKKYYSYDIVSLSGYNIDAASLIELDKLTTVDKIESSTRNVKDFLQQLRTAQEHLNTLFTATEPASKSASPPPSDKQTLGVEASAGQPLAAQQLSPKSSSSPDVQIQQSSDSSSSVGQPISDGATNLVAETNAQSGQKLPAQEKASEGSSLIQQMSDSPPSSSSSNSANTANTSNSSTDSLQVPQEIVHNQVSPKSQDAQPVKQPGDSSPNPILEVPKAVSSPQQTTESVIAELIKSRQSSKDEVKKDPLQSTAQQSTGSDSTISQPIQSSPNILKSK